MANPDRPNGFRPVGTLSGAPWQGSIRRAKMADITDATNDHGDIYIGDPITVDTSGFAVVADSGESKIIGVCVGVGYIPAGNTAAESGMFNAQNLEKRYGNHDDADAAVVIWIYYAPSHDTIFEVQNAAAMAITVNAVGLELDITNTAATAHGSRTTSLSSCELTTDTNSDVKVVAHPEYPDNDLTLANARLHVMFADTEFRAPADAAA